MPVLWIRIGFNAGPDLAFYLNADPDPDLGSQLMRTTCGSGSCQTLQSQKVELYMKYIL